MSKNIVLGIDTSNYTTSVAIITEEGELLANIKRPLTVKEGERGLRQSDAVFSHIKNLPSAFEEAKKFIANNKIMAIGVSEKPRNVEGSYMPCFLAGVAAAEASSASANLPIYKFSHQCGHIMAAVFSSGNFDLLNRDFAAFHISGGTTELLIVHPENFGFKTELVGGTKDLNAGQIIDRIGVKMGFSFPCGKEMEEAALKFEGKVPKKKISRDGLFVNLSGLENMALKLYSETEDKSMVSAFVLHYIASAICEMSEAYIEKYGETHFVYAGGVMSNSIIKSILDSRFDCSFAEPAMSADNAVGVAFLTLKSHKNNLQRVN